MRLDLYTRDERAAEALAYYRRRQTSKFLLWCFWGAISSTIVILALMNLYFPIGLGILEEHAPQVVIQHRLQCKYKGSAIIVDAQDCRELANNPSWPHLSLFKGNSWQPSPSRLFAGAFSTFVYPRPFAIAVALAAFLFLGGLFSAKFIALYQGITFGLLGGIIAYVLAWGWLYMFGSVDIAQNFLPIVGGAVVGMVIFISGFMGSFLPDV